uniref:Solute-binding protein family 3/N-terminal domain-containing protein n=1 Tax=Lactuca sativa TaxID=4236 RepID=A0A9R1VXD6_LACSA|nr:hypothetical protein LSAT_V11C400196700 [Lactuca sativa]
MGLYQEYDATIGEFIIISNRSLYVDFTLPFTDLGVGIISRNAKDNMWIFLDPFSANLWITTSCFFIFLGFVQHHGNWEQPSSLSFQPSFMLTLQSNLSRFVVTVWVFVVLVLTSSCNATLSLLLTVQQI